MNLQQYYLARITPNMEELEKLENVSVYPGMPVQVMIITQKRTAFDYLITPITDSFDRAFREE